MTLATDHHNPSESIAQSTSVDPEQARIVLQELDRIFASRFFKSALRSRQFLEYIVRCKLEGHEEQLKERTIGIAVFHKDPGYATGEDAVVRVQAGEVRRRLEQFYLTEHDLQAVRIELEVGTYLPNIHWLSNDAENGAKVSHAKEEERNSTRGLRVTNRALLLTVFGVILTLVVVSGIVLMHFHAKPAPKSALEQFWGPSFSTSQPVLICLAKPILYRPTFDLYERYRKSHPDTFKTEEERFNQELPLNPNDKITWGEITSFPEFGVAAGDVYAAVRVSSLLGQIGKPSQVRIGGNYTFEDLHNSPSVILGAFDNKWTMQIVPGLHFAFVEEGRQRMIREQSTGGRIWRAEDGHVDYAIVARLFDSKTGQFTIAGAGLMGVGTQAAGEFISNPNFMEQGMHTVSPDWQNKNMELVLQTTLTDSVPGPPRVVASYVW